MARVNLSRAGLLDVVDLVLGDATEIVSRLTGPFDFLFFDADRVSAPEHLKVLLPKLAPGALILADNILSHPAEVAAYMRALEHLPNVINTVVPIGKGLSIVLT
jgi:predicted O-methyltransferase YrrM